MNRLIEKIVFSGLVMACRLATCPTSLSPLLVNATTDGVVPVPSDLIAPSHESLDRENRVLGIGDGLPLGDLPDQPFPALGERHNGWRSAVAFLVGNYGRLPAFHHGDHGVRGSQVDAYNLSHVSEILLILISTLSLLNFSVLLSSRAKGCRKNSS